MMKSLLPLILLINLSPQLHAAQLLDRTIAIVNNTSITEVELKQEVTALALQFQKPGQNLLNDTNFKRQVLERMIQEQVLVNEAKRLGITVSDTQINQALQSLAAANQLDLFSFRRALQNEGINFLHFRKSIEYRLLTEQLQLRQSRDISQVSDQEIDDFLSRNPDNTEREYHLRHILLPIPDAASPEQVREASNLAQNLLNRLRGGENFASLATEFSRGQQSLNGGDLGWLKAAEIPSLFSDQVPAMKTGQIIGPVRSPSGLHLLLLEETRSQNQVMVQQTHARHILIKTSAILNDAQAVEKLDDLKQRIEAGADFSTLARAHSDDLASGAKGGDLGWIKPGEMVDEFEQEMRNLSDGQISEPFKSRFGWHITQVLERRQVDDTEESRRNRIRQDLFKRKQREALQLWQQRLRDEAFVEYLEEK